MKISANEIRVGIIIEHNNDLWEVLKTQHVKPGKGGAFNQVELKSINKNTNTDAVKSTKLKVLSSIRSSIESKFLILPMTISPNKPQKPNGLLQPNGVPIVAAAIHINATTIGKKINLPSALLQPLLNRNLPPHVIKIVGITQAPKPIIINKILEIDAPALPTRFVGLLSLEDNQLGSSGL